MLRFKVGDRVQVVEEIGRFYASRIGVVTNIKQHAFIRSLDEFTIRLADGSHGKFLDFQLEVPPKRYATLLQDSFRSHRVGLRGSGGVRNLLFQSDEIYIHLLTHRMSHGNRILGQILARTDEMQVIERWQVFVMVDNETIQSSRTDTHGEFSFKDVPDGNIMIEVLLPFSRLLASIRIAEPFLTTSVA